nr:hp [Calliteara abietis nucleopolyhedrovirus]
MTLVRVKENDILTVIITEIRLYKIHVVSIEDKPDVNAVLIAHNRKIYFKNQRVRAKVIRVDNNDNVDLIPIETLICASIKQ